MKMTSGFEREEVVDMAHTVKDTIFNRLTPPKFQHLKPLSVYSRMITCDQKASVNYPKKFCNPFINFKIEVVNNCAAKRKLDDSSPEDGYETPAKKASSPKALSPDEGCFMDYFSPPATQDSVSSFAISKPALLDTTQAIWGEIKETVSSQLHSEHVECGSSTETGDSKRTLPQSLKFEKFLLNPTPAFDCDVDDILCLNPFGICTAGGLSDNVESCKTPSSNPFQKKPVLIPTVAQGQELERGDGQRGKGQEELKDACVNVRDVEEDIGYISMSYKKDLGKDLSHSVYTQLPPATSSPVLKIDEVKAPEDERHSKSSFKTDKQAALAGQHISFTVSDLCPVVSDPLFESVNSPVEPLEGDVEEGWNIGPPTFESSVCHSVTVKLNAGSEPSRQVSEEMQGGLSESVNECQSRLGEENTLDTSYETTLPLQVQVKSVVVAPSQHTSSRKPVTPPLSEHNTKPSPKENRDLARRQRPVIFDRGVDWEREKRMYVHSVTRHINEKPGSGQDVMAELMNLMTHVADQTPDTNGRQWQHPSDLTCRNYQRRFGNMKPTMALCEWQAKNCVTHKRFAKVPKIFERSPFP